MARPLRMLWWQSCNSRSKPSEQRLPRGRACKVIEAVTVIVIVLVVETVFVIVIVMVIVIAMAIVTVIVIVLCGARCRAIFDMSLSAAGQEC